MKTCRTQPALRRGFSCAYGYNEGMDENPYRSPEHSRPPGNLPPYIPNQLAQMTFAVLSLLIAIGFGVLFSLNGTVTRGLAAGAVSGLIVFVAMTLGFRRMRRKAPP